MDIKNIRLEYEKFTLSENIINSNPYKQFSIFIKEAIEKKISEPTAMIISTVGNNSKPSSRVVLLKDFSEQNGFVFFTNYLSKKGEELEKNKYICALFFWKEFERQVRIEGKAEKIPVADSENYFNSRPLESRISAIISEQSKKIPNREYLEKIREEFINKNIEIKKPENWGGYRIIPDYFEFWQGRENRLHDRIVYKFTENKWVIERLAP